MGTSYMKVEDYINSTIAVCYAEGLPKEYFPVLLHPSGKKYVYQREIDEDTYDVSEGFCVCDNWSDEPLPVSPIQQKALDLYFLKSYSNALKYARLNGWNKIRLISVFPVLVYELLPHSINVLEDGREVTGCLEIWPHNPEPVLVISDVDKKGELTDYGKNAFENYVINVINKRYINTLIEVIAKDNKVHDFNLRIPIINSHFGEFEEIKNVKCSWKRIVKIASYYSRYGLSVIYYGSGNLLLWASYKHKRLPVPFTRNDIEKAGQEWDQKVFDNPFLEHSYIEDDNLTKWDYEILDKARQKMK